VEVNADNKSGKLIPYLTANVKFIRAEELNAMTVPVAALRFVPPTELQLAPAPEIQRREGVLWVEDKGGKLRPVKVKLGLSNNIVTAVKTDELKAGDAVITGMVRQMPGSAKMSDGSTKNPFMPNMPKRRARGSAGQRERAAERATQGGK
jgi:HlyD family secretion protein